MVVNMTPNALSAESNQDSEPFLSINPTNAGVMVGSAFTPDPGGGGLAPVYITLNSGDTWGLSTIVPSAGSLTGTGDITHAHAQSQRFFAGILRLPGSLIMDLLRTTSIFTTMTAVATRTGVDQPFVQASTAGMGDRIYVGNNDLSVTNNRTATVDVSLDGGSTWNVVRIEGRAASPQDGPSIRPTVARDGTVYAGFFGWRNFNGTSVSGTASGDICVVRDDNGATGANPFSDLTDGAGVRGQIVAANRTIPWSNQQTLGQERIGSTLSIAVDPNNSATVYITWCDRVNNGALYTAHVRRSTDRGQTWSGDLRTLLNTTCISLAVADNGTVGLLYQQVTNQGSANARWRTVLEQTRNAFTTRNTTILANVPATTPAPIFLPYIGDYNFLTSVGGEFRGIFSANNTPNNTNFPNGVVYQRSADFNTQRLLDAAGNTVPISIDPFYFRVPAID